MHARRDEDPYLFRLCVAREVKVILCINSLNLLRATRSDPRIGFAAVWLLKICFSHDDHSCRVYNRWILDFYH